MGGRRWLGLSIVCLTWLTSCSAPESAGPDDQNAPVDHDTPGLIVVLGSSTAAGTGPSQAENAWVERYRSSLAGDFTNFELTNLAVNGYTTYQIQPSDFAPPPERPAPGRRNNVTFALGLEPDAIIINMPSNDTARGFSLPEQLDNYQRVAQLAAEHGVLVWIATTQPRNFAEEARRDALMIARDAIQTTYGERAIDFWTDLAEPDGRIRPEYDSGDGTHLNDAGHAVLADRVIAAEIPRATIWATR